MIWLNDPEMVGQLLAAHLPDVAVGGFTELEPWAPLVAETAVALAGLPRGSTPA